MTWINYNPTAAERRSIEAGFSVVANFVQREYELEQHVKSEQRGAGFSSDRIPLIAAKALMSKWFLEGVNDPNAPARRVWNIRPAALYAMGNGMIAAERVTQEQREALQAAVTANETTLARMQRVSANAIYNWIANAH